MAKPSARSTYVRIVGEISIWWNELEGRLNGLVFHYLPLEPPIASFILGEMGNATKAEFATFLIENYEDNALLREHGLHAIALINRLRENRNILEHARPFAWLDEYHGTVFKVTSRGRVVEFEAPIKTLKVLLETMKSASPYLRWLTFCLRMEAGEVVDGIKGGRDTPKAALRVLASIDRPQLPDKIAPLPPPATP